jgi:hypothetical protein
MRAVTSLAGGGGEPGDAVPDEGPQLVEATVGRDLALGDEIVVGPHPPSDPGIERVVEVRPVFHDRDASSDRAAHTVLRGHRSRVDPSADQEGDVDRPLERARVGFHQPPAREGDVSGLMAAVHAMAVFGQAAFRLLCRDRVGADHQHIQGLGHGLIFSI